MAASLPNELLQQILADLLVDCDLRTRIRHRRAFSLVCSSWRTSLLQPWTEIALYGFNQVSALTKFTEAQGVLTPVDRELVPAQHAIRSLYLAINQDSIRYSGTHLGRLLRRMKNVDSLEVGAREMSKLGEEYAMVLGLHWLRGVRHLAMSSLDLSGLMLSKVVSEWRSLESLTVTNCRLGRASVDASAFGSHLTHVSLDISSDASEYAHLINSLPSSVRSLTLSHQRLWSHQITADQLENALARLAPRLRELELRSVESMEGAWMAESGAQHARVVVAMIAKLRSVERLTLPLCALSKLEEEVGSMEALEHLTLRAAAAERGAKVGVYEIVRVIERAPASLAKLSLDGVGHESWSTGEREHFRRVAADSGVKLTLA